MRKIVAVVLGVCVLLSGCATAPKDPYVGATAETLQNGVLAVTDASAAGDPASALARLDELQAALLDANAKGTVDQSRFDSISAAIALVRADLEKAIAAQVEVVPEVSQETPMTDKEAKKAAEEAKKAAEEAKKEAEKQQKDNKDD